MNEIQLTKRISICDSLLKRNETDPFLKRIIRGDEKWEVMPHPPYSPDLAPSDYNLFCSLQSHLNGKTFDSNEAIKNELIQFFASKNQTFYGNGIKKLTKRWQKVIEQNGQYIID